MKAESWSVSEKAESGQYQRVGGGQYQSESRELVSIREERWSVSE